MQIGNRLLTIAAPNVGMHRPTLNRTGADERHLDNDVVKTSRFEPRQGSHLGPALDLEDTHSVGPTEHAVHIVFLRDGGQIDLVSLMLADEIDRVMQGAEHAQTQQIELHEPRRSAIVFVPLQHTAVLHAAPLDWADLDDGAIANDHATRVDAEMTRRIFDFGGKLEHRCGNVLIGQSSRGRNPAPTIDLFAPCILLTRRVSQCLGHIAYGRTGSIGDDVGNLRSVVAAMALIHVLDDLFAPVAFDIDIDVGRAIALGRQKSLEQQAQRNGIGLGNAQRVARCAVGGAAPTLAIDIGPLAELHDVPDHQEVAREIERLDDRKLVVDGAPRPRPHRKIFARLWPLAVSTARPCLDQHTQILHLGELLALRPTRAWERRQIGCHQRQIEGPGAPNGCRGFDNTRIARKAPRLFGATAHMSCSASRQPRVHLFETAPGTHRPQRRGQAPMLRCCVVHIVGSNACQIVTSSKLGKRIVARRVEWVAVIPQLDDHTFTTEQRNQLLQLARRRSRTLAHQRRRHHTMATAGEHPPMVAADLG